MGKYLWRNPTNIIYLTCNFPLDWGMFSNKWLTINWKYFNWIHTLLKRHYLKMAGVWTLSRDTTAGTGFNTKSAPCTNRPLSAFFVTKDAGAAVAQVCECFWELVPVAGCPRSDPEHQPCAFVTFITTMLILLLTNHNEPLAADSSL